MTGSNGEELAPRRSFKASGPAAGPRAFDRDAAPLTVHWPSTFASSLKPVRKYCGFIPTHAQMLSKEKIQFSV